MDLPTAAAVLMASLVLLVQFLDFFFPVCSLNLSDFRIFIRLVCTLVIYYFLCVSESELTFEWVFA